MPESENRESSYPTPFQHKTVWAAITGVAIVLIGCIGVGIIFLGARILQFLQPVLVPLAAAGIIAYLIDPLVGKLIARGVPRIRAILVVFSSFIGMILILMLSVIPAAIEQGFDLLERRAEITEKAGNYIETGLLKMEKRIRPLFNSADGEPSNTPADLFGYKHQIVGDTARLPSKGKKLVAISTAAGAAPHIRLFDSEGTPTDADGTTLATSKPSQLSELKNLLKEKTSPPEAPVVESGPPADQTVDPDAAIIESAFEIVGVGQPHWLKAQLKEWLMGHYPSLLTRAWKFVSSGLQGFLGVFGYVFGLFLVPVYLYYFLKEGAGIKENWSKYLQLQQSRFKDEVVSTLTEINGYLISFFRGQMLVSMIDGALIGICLTFIGMPNGLLIGVFVALLGLIPYLGNLLCWIPAVLISIAHFGATDKAGTLIHTWSWLPEGAIWPYPVIVTGIFVIVQQINGLVTAPKIVGDSVGLHPLTVIFSVLFWSLLIGGLLGALLAVPLTAALKVLFQRYVWERGKDMWEQRQAALLQSGAVAK